MPRVARPVGVASGSKRSQGLSYQSDMTLGAICGANQQADLSQPGGGDPGTALEDLLVNVNDDGILAGQAPPDGGWEVGRAHSPTTVEPLAREAAEIQYGPRFAWVRHCCEHGAGRYGTGAICERCRP
jgi:hypothetical protein